MFFDVLFQYPYHLRLAFPMIRWHRRRRRSCAFRAMEAVLSALLLEGRVVTVTVDVLLTQTTIAKTITEKR